MFVGRYAKQKFALSRITEVRELPQTDKHGLSLVQLRLVDDSAVMTAASFDDAMGNAIQASFPADGARLIDVMLDDNDRPEGIHKTSVLGFVLDGWGDLRAVTLEGSREDPVILFADGHIERFEDRWDSEALYLADKQAAFDQARRAKSAANA